MVKTNQHSEKEVQQLFSRIAPQYDSLNDVISLGLQKTWRQKLWRRLSIRDDFHCLDLCCGTGDLTIQAAQQLGPKGLVVGLDFNQEMLNIAQQKIQQAAVSVPVKLQYADVMSLPFAEQSFDIITIGFGLRNVPDAERVLRESYRVLKPGGQFACLEMSQPSTAVIKIFWQLYLKIFPRLAQICGGNYRDYQYLQTTTQSFLSAPQLLQLLQKVGFQHCNYTQLTWGAAALHLGRK